MRDKPLRKAVLDDLSPEQLNLVANQLGTSPRKAKQVVGETVAALTGMLAQEADTAQGAYEVEQALTEAQDPDSAAAAGAAGSARSARSANVRPPKGATPLAGAMPFGGGGLGGSALGGGLLGSVIGKASMPVARAVAKRTGIPVTQVASVMKLLVPVAMTAISALAKRRKVQADGLSEMLTEEQKSARRPGGLSGALARLLGGGSSGGPSGAPSGGGRHAA